VLPEKTVRRVAASASSGTDARPLPVPVAPTTRIAASCVCVRSSRGGHRATFRSQSPEAEQRELGRQSRPNTARAQVGLSCSSRSRERLPLNGREGEASRRRRRRQLQLATHRAFVSNLYGLASLQGLRSLLSLWQTLASFSPY
jgi:hypothetical protein